MTPRLSCWRLWFKVSQVHVEHPVQKLIAISYQTDGKKQTVELSTPNNGTPVDEALTVYPVHTDYEEEWRKNTPLSESNTHCEQL